MTTANMTKDEVVMAVRKARTWAKEHFNDTGARSSKTPLDSLLGKPGLFCEFDGYAMEVTPSFCGKKLSVPSFHYTLKIYPSGKLVWQGKHPLWDTPMPELIVEDPEAGKLLQTLAILGLMQQ
jgi:hypothetical protein